jgi:uncharacterized protein (TIGR02808 family)
MSLLESIFWHVLGYSAIPVILIIGIVASTLLFGLLTRLFTAGDKSK